MPSVPAAVLWDMDGTLIDTEPYWMSAETALVTRHGGTWSHEQALAMVGMGLEDAAAVFQEAGVRMSVREIVDELTAEVTAQLRTQGNPYRPGAVAMLRGLRDAGIPTALVTMSMRSMTEVFLAQLGFDAFDVVVAGDDATRPKPFPDPYLQAAEALGVAPHDTLVVEDSPNGMRSAVASGAVTLGIPLMVSLVGTGADGLWDTLEGRSVADLADHFAEHRDGTAR